MLWFKIIDADESQQVPNEESPLVVVEENSTEETREKNDRMPSFLNRSEFNTPTMYIFFQIHTMVTVISLALLTIAQALPPPHQRPILITAIVHFYAVIASVIGIIVELDLSDLFVSKIVPLLDKWVVRGLFYIFLGAFTMDESTFVSRVHNHGNGDNFGHGTEEEGFFYDLGARVSSAILWVSCLGLLISGLLYILMGSLFMKRLKKKSGEAYEQRLTEMFNRAEF